MTELRTEAWRRPALERLRRVRVRINWKNVKRNQMLPFGSWLSVVNSWGSVLLLGMKKKLRGDLIALILKWRCYVLSLLASVLLCVRQMAPSCPTGPQGHGPSEAS